MLNYHKTYRESLDKLRPKQLVKKQPTINRSHTSSINLKLLADNQNIKNSFKQQIKQNHDPYYNLSHKKEYLNHNKSKSNVKNQNNPVKYSFKIKQHDAQDYCDGVNVARLKTNYEQSNIKPFQESNRCLITDRNSSTSRGIQYKLLDRSKSKKNGVQIKTQYKQNFKGQIEQLNNINDKFNNLQIEQNEIKIKKDVSTKHNTQSMSSNLHDSQKYVKISVYQLKKLYEKYINYQNQVEMMEKQLGFYRKTACKNSKNSVLLSLSDK